MNELTKFESSMLHLGLWLAFDLEERANENTRKKD